MSNKYFSLDNLNKFKGSKTIRSNQNELVRSDTLRSLETSDTLRSTKKRTSFNQIVSVINVENYKRYNSMNMYKKNSSKNIYDTNGYDDLESEETCDINKDKCFLCVIF